MIDDSTLDLIRNALSCLNTIVYKETVERNSRTVWTNGIVSTDSKEFKEWQEKATVEPPATDVLQLNNKKILQDVSENHNIGETETMEFKNKIHERSNGLLEYNARIKGVRITAYGRTKTELWQNFEKAKRAAKNGKKQPKKKNKPQVLKFHKWLDQWLVTYKSGKIAADTEFTYMRYLKRIKLGISDTPLSQLCSITLQKFLNSIPTTRTRKTFHMLLGDCLNKAYRAGLIKTNPMLAVDNVKHEYVQGIPLSLEEEKAFLTALDGLENQDLAAYFKFCLWTGCRRSEAMGVKWSDVNFEKGQIHIPGTKTKKSDRIIPLFKRVKTLLDGLSRSGEYLFAFSPDYATKVFRELMPNHKLHDLRHTFATRCLEKEINMKTVQMWLGHATYEMTANTYSHVLDTFIKSELEKLDD